jgi:hypothetical protein
MRDADVSKIVFSSHRRSPSPSRRRSRRSIRMASPNWRSNGPLPTMPARMVSATPPCVISTPQAPRPMQH